MRYSIMILGAPYSSQAVQSAYSFSQALLSAGHSIERVFLYQDGVHTATTLSAPPRDELNLSQAWQALISEHKIDCVVCVAAALRRGLIDAKEQSRYKLPAANLSEATELSGLGQLIEAASSCDRLITFGA